MGRRTQTERWDEAARLIAVEMRSGKQFTYSDAMAYGVNNIRAPLVIESAKEIHARWMLSHFAPPVTLEP